jgi:predicted membrane-bound spermidine synthase
MTEAVHSSLRTVDRQRILWRLVPLFAVSGIAALVYQICWQRMLVMTFGADIESLTIIVSAFMLGLGLGALVGGQLADRFRDRIIEMFATAELVIGLFGAFSPLLIPAVGDVAMHGPPAVVAATSFLLLLVPTSLMGATLPMLVAYCVQTYRTIGATIGLLYFVNTMGAAAGAAITGFVWFYFFGLEATIHSAAALNVAVGAGAWLLLRRRRV